MCTIITVSRAFFEANKQDVLNRINSDGVSNDDGWGLVLLGDRPANTISVKSLELDTIKHLIENTKWNRMFLHARFSTTSTKGIFGCHNFTTVGNGLKENVKNGSWIVQHNGILKSKESNNYLVDSMYIPEVLRLHGLRATKGYLTSNENYANVFLINPQSGMYVVTRASSGSLHTDGNGNYSTGVIGPINSPVPHNSATDHFHLWSRKEEPVTTPSFSKQEMEHFLKLEVRAHDDVLAKECEYWGDDALNIYQDDYKQFSDACQVLGYLDKKVMRLSTYTYLTKAQQRWCRALGISIEKPKKNKKSKRSAS